MDFYDLSKEERNRLVEKINQEVKSDLKEIKTDNMLNYFSDEDTYIGKTGYLVIGKIFYVQRQAIDYFDTNYKHQN